MTKFRLEVQEAEPPELKLESPEPAKPKRKRQPLPGEWKRVPNPYMEGMHEARLWTTTDEEQPRRIEGDVEPIPDVTKHGEWQVEIYPLGNGPHPPHLCLSENGTYKGSLRKGCEAADEAIARLLGRTIQ